MTRRSAFGVGLAAGVGIGAYLAARRSRRDLDAYREVAGVYERQLSEAERDREELREGIPAVWDRGFEAGQQLAAFQLVQVAVEGIEREKARLN